MLALQAGDLAGGLLGMALLALICGGYGYLLVGGAVRVARGAHLELAGISILVGFVTLSWIGSLLAVASLFTWWLYLAAAAIIALALRQWGPRWPRIALAPAPIAFQIAALLLLAGAAWLFARPSETFLLFEDSSVYTIAGINLSRTGTLIPSIEPLISKTYQASRYLGPFYWWDSRPFTDGLAIGFLPTPKVWAAVGAWLFGPGGTVWIAPLSGLLGLLAFLLFVRRAVGHVAALVATAAVAVSFPQVWHARVLMSETFAQIALFAGLLLLGIERQETRDRRPGLWGILAALSLGLLSFIRLEGGLMAGAVVLGWLAAHCTAQPGPLAGRPPRWAPRWLVWVGAASLVAMGLSYGASPHYYLRQVILVLTRQALQYLVIGGIGLAIAGVLVHRWGIERLRRVIPGKPWARIGLAALALAWVLVAGLDLWLRGTSNRGVTSWLIAYPGWAGFVVGVAGLVWLSFRRPRAELYALLALTMLSAIGLTLRPLVILWHPWAIRRFVPYVMPALALGAAIVLARASEALHSVRGRFRFWRWPGQAALLACAVLYIASVAQVTLPFATFREQAGVWGQMEELAALYPQDSMLIFDDGAMGQRLPQVMELVFDQGAIAHIETPGSAEFVQLEAAVDAALAQGRRVFLNVVDGNMAWYPEGYALQSHGSYTVETPVLRYEPTPPPTEASIATLRFLVDIYEVLPREALAPSREPTVAVPLGAGSYPYLRRGFHGVETDAQGRVFRWTGPYAQISVPIPALDEPVMEVEFTLDVASWRPAPADDMILAVEMEGETVLETSIGHSGELQQIRVRAPYAPGQGQARLAVGIRSDTWQPKEWGIEDSRTLGIMLYGLTVAFHGPAG